jgi:preprotein translocase subunit SecG
MFILLSPALINFILLQPAIPTYTFPSSSISSVFEYSWIYKHKNVLQISNNWYVFIFSLLSITINFTSFECRNTTYSLDNSTILRNGRSLFCLHNSDNQKVSFSLCMSIFTTNYRNHQKFFICNFSSHPLCYKRLCSHKPRSFFF